MTDLILEMNTKEGVDTFTTDKINGELLSLILFSEDPISFKIDSEYGYNILTRERHQGIKNLIIRYPADSPLGFPYSEHIDKISINEKLIVQIMGRENQNVKIIIRYK